MVGKGANNSKQVLGMRSLTSRDDSSTTSLNFEQMFDESTGELKILGWQANFSREPKFRVTPDRIFVFALTMLKKAWTQKRKEFHSIDVRLSNKSSRQNDLQNKQCDNKFSYLTIFWKRQTKSVLMKNGCEILRSFHSYCRPTVRGKNPYTLVQKTITVKF